MKTILIIFFVYFSGCVSCYELGKAQCISLKRNIGLTPEWKTRGRRFYLGISATSWIGTTAVGLAWMTQFDRAEIKANW